MHKGQTTTLSALKNKTNTQYRQANPTPPHPTPRSLNLSALRTMGTQHQPISTLSAQSTWAPHSLESWTPCGLTCTFLSLPWNVHLQVLLSFYSTFFPGPSQQLNSFHYHVSQTSISCPAPSLGDPYFTPEPTHISVSGDMFKACARSHGHSSHQKWSPTSLSLNMGWPSRHISNRRRRK